MPVLVIAVVAFVIFNVMMLLFVAAAVSEQRELKRERQADVQPEQKVVR